ncbi:MAG: hypothetical protein LBF22_08415 [Deltaproteobacteria bacterium]|jgi:hypothetical protein|nr:hypothetical protein [Deltaproteobacteria bacterium]
MPKFYKPSKLYNPSATIIIPIVVAFVLSVFALIYNYLATNNEYIDFFGLLLWLPIVFLISIFTVKGFHVRHPFLAGILAILGGVIGLYVSWASWASLQIQIPKDLKITKSLTQETATTSNFLTFLEPYYDPETLEYLLKSPTELAITLKSIKNTNYKLYNLNKRKPSYPYVYWTLESLFILAVLFFIFLFQAGRPYSEESHQWMKRTTPKNGTVQLPDNQIEWVSIILDIKNGDLDYFLSSPAVSRFSNKSFLKITIFTCQGALESVVTVTLHTFTPSVQNKPKRTWEYIVKNMLVSSIISERLLFRLA